MPNGMRVRKIVRVANVRGRATLLASDSSGGDVEGLSDGRFPSELERLYEVWGDFIAWGSGVNPGDDVTFTPSDLGAPSPRPRQIFAIGLNYRAHADESGYETPSSPTVFTKFQSSLTGPVGTVNLPEGGNTDWEAELVVIVGKTSKDVDEADSWAHVAGLTLGQDLSERRLQQSGPAPQFSLGKSLPGFAPTGPWVATADEFSDRDAIALGCSVNGEVRQDGSTRDLVFAVPALLSILSRTVTLFPGDLIFTGTPAGVGVGMSPPKFLTAGDELVTWGEGLGTLVQRFA
jgi:2,4-didehydro-3-deoxy-L-rhamnonate hydrolase